MATPFSHPSKTFEDLEKELLYFGKSNASTLKQYAVTVPIGPINDDMPAENKDKSFDIKRALSLQPTIEAYEKSNFIRRWWLWLATDISNMSTAYYYARATLILKTLTQQQPLSSAEHQIITQGVHQHNRFSALGSIYRSLNSKTQHSLAIRPNVSSINKALPKPITLFGMLLNLLGFNPLKTTTELATARDEANKNPAIAKHAEFKRQFDAYKESLNKLVTDLEVSALGNQIPRDTISLRSQLNELKKKERGLMLMTHPDKNPRDYQATANANFQRLQSFIDWKTNLLEKAIAQLESIDPKDNNATASIILLKADFNSLNKRDEGYHQEISQALFDQQKITEIAERIKNEYAPKWQEVHMKKETAKKESERLHDLLGRLDAENAELRKNAQLRKIAASLQTSHKPKDLHVISCNDDTASTCVNQNSTVDDSTARPYFKAGKSVPVGPVSEQESATATDTPTPIN